MPANIAEGKNGVHRAFYAYREAWHKLGRVVKDAAKWSHAMKLAQIDYELDLVPAYVARGRGYVEVPETKFIRRRDTGDIFAPVTNRYQLIQNVEVGEVLDAIVQDKEAHYVAAAALGRGERVFAVLQLDLVKGLTIKGDPSKLDGYLFATTRHDGAGALQLSTAMQRVECQNMLDMAMSAAAARGKLISIRHTGDTQAKVEEAREILGFVNRWVEEFKVVSDALADTPLPKGYVGEFLEQLIPIPPEMERTGGREEARKAIASIYRDSKSLHGVPGSAYRLMQAVAEYGDHVRPVRGDGEQKLVEARFRSIYEGPAHELKQQALDLLRQQFEIGVPVKVGA